MVHASDNMVALEEKGVLEHAASSDVSEDLSLSNDSTIMRARRKYVFNFQILKYPLIE
jgi:hypothetical protein